ncbi:butyrophilin subfamily 1 member A1-like [Alosa alosa]|uniref:butyrophilin subfamily 1 member A1-like n=1 Tax=Alosa alosa TaxID=278164 RepID=UPI0020152A93|nr:butyrophilin subfamily 1 member A1-like [Alosa alosa]
MAAGYKRDDLNLVTTEDLITLSVGDDVTLSCHLSPKVNAVYMEIRWFKGTDCIYLYENGRVIEGSGYEGRVSVNTLELKKGDVSLRLKEAKERDIGVYTCEVISEENKAARKVRWFCPKLEETEKGSLMASGSW